MKNFFDLFFAQIFFFDQHNLFYIFFLLSWIYKKEIAKKQNISKFFKSDFFYETVVLAVPAIILMSVVLAISFLLFVILTNV